jgi:hypothetical protein
MGNRWTSRPSADPFRDQHWVGSPITTRHSQGSLLLVSFTWGLSYVMPSNQRVPWSEVFPPDLTQWSAIPVWGYGILMLSGALVASFGENLIRNTTQGRLGWHLSFLSHALLCAVYYTLALSAMVYGIKQALQMNAEVAAIISALSRPVLWGFVGYLHLTYAQLPAPASPPRQRRKKHKRRIKIVRDE